MSSSGDILIALDVLTALCCECGNARTVSRRGGAGDGNRRLRCTHCGVTTMHAVVGLSGTEGCWREFRNTDGAPKLSVGDKLDLLRSLGVAVEEQATRDIDGSPFHVSMTWDPELGFFSVVVDRDRPEWVLHEGLDEALDRVKDPGAHMWFVWVNEVNTVCEMGWVEVARGERTRS